MAKRKVTVSPAWPGGAGAPGNFGCDLFPVNVYIRVSTDRQAKEGDSLEEQESELKKFCEYRGFRIHKILIERGKSGGNTNRPEYQKLLEDIESGTIRAVVVKKLDRLSRSLLDFEQLMTRLQAKEVEFISLRENFDTTTAMGKAMLRIALIFAQLEREQTAERIKDVMDYRATQGLYNGSAPPFGYVNVDKALVPHEREKESLVLIFDQFLKLHSLSQVTKLLNEAKIPHRKGRKWADTTVQTLLKNPIYKGYIQWNGTLYAGVHKPLISEKKFSEVQDLMKRVAFASRTKSHALLQKLLFCGVCGSMMSPSFAYNRTKVKYYYYKCMSGAGSHEPGKKGCTVRYVNMEALERLCVSSLLALSQAEMFAAVELRILKHNGNIEEAVQSSRDQQHRFETHLKEITLKKDRYFDSLMNSPFLSGERSLIEERIEELKKEGQAIQGKMDHLALEATLAMEERVDLIGFKQSLIEFKSKHELFSKEELKHFLNTHLKAIQYLPDRLSIHFQALPWPLEFPP